MAQTDAKTLLLLKPRGFCAGVVRAIDIVRIALETFGAPIYVRKEIVHNRYVVDELTAKGAIFVDSVEEGIGVLSRVLALDRGGVRRRFEERFSATRMAHDYVKIYERQLGGRAARGEAATNGARARNGADSIPARAIGQPSD